MTRSSSSVGKASPSYADGYEHGFSDGLWKQYPSPDWAAGFRAGKDAHKLLHAAGVTTSIEKQEP